jgi:hypothetical protein
LISGGNTEKFISYRPFSTRLFSTAQPGGTANDTQQTPTTRTQNSNRDALGDDGQ